MVVLEQDDEGENVRLTANYEFHECTNVELAPYRDRRIFLIKLKFNFSGTVASLQGIQAFQPGGFFR
jgi:hypothetical protein